MLMKISDKLMRMLMPNEIGSERYEVCRYGCELWIYTVISTAGLLLAGWLMNSFAESAVMVCIFYLCQSNGGGYHATSHIGCFLTMLTGLLCGLLLTRIPLSIIFYGCLAAAACLVLLLFPLQLHKNKSYLQANAPKLRRHSRLVTILIAVFPIFMGFAGWDMFFRSGCVALGLSAISRLYAKAIQSAGAREDVRDAFHHAEQKLPPAEMSNPNIRRRTAPLLAPSHRQTPFGKFEWHSKHCLWTSKGENLKIPPKWKSVKFCLQRDTPDPLFVKNSFCHLRRI